jgi:hypothetical protein
MSIIATKCFFIRFPAKFFTESQNAAFSSACRQRAGHSQLNSRHGVRPPSDTDLAVRLKTWQLNLIASVASDISLIE